MAPAKTVTLCSDLASHGAFATICVHVAPSEEDHTSFTSPLSVLPPRISSALLKYAPAWDERFVHPAAVVRAVQVVKSAVSHTSLQCVGLLSKPPKT